MKGNIKFFKIDKLILKDRIKDIIVLNKSLLSDGEILSVIYILSQEK